MQPQYCNSPILCSRFRRQEEEQKAVKDITFLRNETEGKYSALNVPMQYAFIILVKVDKEQGKQLRIDEGKEMSSGLF
jgi:hypothetical protein